jgi:crotonobetainyl-CoA:carnitine CoA-transferase CaiB-like acyl-CoA transferase
MTLSAASGIMCSVSDPDTGHPLKLAGNQSLLSSAQAAALAACHAIDLARGVHSVHLDASAQEATIAMGPILDLIQQHLNCQSGMGAKRYGAPASFYQCMDGLIRISAMEDHQWQGVMRAMGSPAWALRFNEAESRIEFSEELDKGVARWTARQTKADAETKLQAAGVPATAMYRPAEILESPQMAHRGTLRSFEVGDGVQVRAVGLPFLDTHDISDGSVGARPSGIRGLRVLEASHVLAVPLAGALLGALGADVTKVEDVNRLDMYRRRGPYIDGEVGINRSAYFAMVNHSKSSFTFNSEDDDRAIESLIDEADVFIENVGARRLARFGLSEVYEGAHLNRLAVSSSGFGNTGPQAHYRAYAYNLQASCGLGYLTRNDAGEPAEIDMPWADLLSGYALATIVAAWAVGPEGNEGRVIDFAMSELIDARFNEFLAAASIDPASDETVDRANAVSPFAPSGVYQSADGWIAISVDGDEAFSDLVRVLDLDPTRMERFATRECRQALRRELNEVLSDAFVKRTVAQWRELLREVDVFTERVAQTTDLFEDEHLESRGFFGEVVHPEWGRRRLIGIPWRMAGGPAVELAYPPLLAPSSSVRPKANQRAQEEAR